MSGRAARLGCRPGTLLRFGNMAATVTAVALSEAPLVLDPKESLTNPKRCPRMKRVHGRYFPCGRWDCGPCGGYRSRVYGRMLVNDALSNSCPNYVMTLTTVDPFTTSETFRRGVQSVTQRLRRHLPFFELASKVEFTTGHAARSGGFRRIHSHGAIKSASGEDVRIIEGLVRETWQSVTGADRVEVAEMITPGGALHYMGLHHGKIAQAPPADWRGNITRWSRRYLSEPVGEARARAKEELACEALAHVTGLSLSDAVFLRAQDAAQRAALESAFLEYCELKRSPGLSVPEVTRLEVLDGVEWGALYEPVTRQLPAGLVGSKVES